MRPLAIDGNAPMPPVFGNGFTAFLANALKRLRLWGLWHCWLLPVALVRRSAGKSGRHRKHYLDRRSIGAVGREGSQWASLNVRALSGYQPLINRTWIRGGLR